MRFSLAVCCFGSLFAIVVNHASAADRQKRFFGGDDWPMMPDDLYKISEFVKELTSSLTGQSTRGDPQFFTESPKRQDEIAPEPEKKGKPKSTDRELEGDDEEETKVEGTTQEPEITAESTKPSAETELVLPFHIPFSISFGMLAPWWSGPHVCADRTEVDEPEEDSIDIPGISFNMESTQCSPSESTYICTKKIQSNGMRKTIVIKKQCCYGYVRRADGKPGCTALEMDNLIDTLKGLERTKFMQLIDTTKMEEKVKTENLTVFAPSNDAIIDFEDENEDNEISALPSSKPVKDDISAFLVQGHMAEGFFDLDLVENDHVLKSLNGLTSIRINKYQPDKVLVTANCVPLSGKNNFATNGIVHLTPEVVPFPDMTVGEMIEKEPEFSILKRLLNDHGILEELKKEDKVWTVFAPTNEAFNAIEDPELIKQIENGEGCFESILRQHIVKTTVCSSAIVNQARIKNTLDNVLKLTKDDAGILRIEGGGLLTSIDNLGINGVLHSVEKVMIPPQARTVLKALEDEGRTDILDLIEDSDLLSIFQELRNVTFFMPSQEALKNWLNCTNEAMRNETDPVTEMLLHHIAEPKTTLSMFANNANLKTADGQTINIKLHELFPGIVTGATAQCAYITSHDKRACGAVLHKVNKVLEPAKGNVVDVMQNMDGYKIVSKLLKDTEIEAKLKEAGPFTFLAPSDEAFESLSEKELADLKENKTRAEEILKYHVLPEILCCSDISHASPFQRQYVRSYAGSLVPLHRSLHDRVRFGRARANKCDIPATNGLVHTVNRILVPRRPSIFDMDLWSIL